MSATFIYYLLMLQFIAMPLFSPDHKHKHSDLLINCAHGLGNVNLESLGGKTKCLILAVNMCTLAQSGFNF